MDLAYMIHLGFRDDDVTIISLWEQAFHDVTKRVCDSDFPSGHEFWDTLPAFCPVRTGKVPGCFSKSTVGSETKFVLETSHPFVRGFKTRYPGAKGKRLLEYIMRQYEEFENSDGQYGFQMVLTK